MSMITAHRASAATVVTVPAATTHWWNQARHLVLQAIQRVFATSSTVPDRRPRQHYPPRHRYLEDALMAREMYRL